MMLEMKDHGGGEFAFPNVIQVLFESGEDGMFCFADVMFIAGGACNDVNDVTGV